MDELEDFLASTLDRQIQAEEAIHNGDRIPRLKMWSVKDPLTLFGSYGPIKRGSHDVTRTFWWVASLFSNCTEYNYELIAAGVSGDLAYTVGLEHSTRSVRGSLQESATLRVTHIYRREDGEWKIVHRHGDIPPIYMSHHEETFTSDSRIIEFD